MLKVTKNDRASLVYHNVAHFGEGKGSWPTKVLGCENRKLHCPVVVEQSVEDGGCLEHDLWAATKDM